LYQQAAHRLNFPQTEADSLSASFYYKAVFCASVLARNDKNPGKCMKNSPEVCGKALQ
jgi:hypothetical protein